MSNDTPGAAITRTRVVVLTAAAAIVVVIAIVIAVVDWPSSKTSHSPPPPTASSPQPSASPTTDPQVQAAIASYEAFAGASNVGLRDPGSDYSAKLAANAVDPALAKVAANIASFRLAGIAYRGAPPTPRIDAKSLRADLEAKPWPTVTLTDCPTLASSWQAINQKTKAPVPVKYPPGAAKPPHAVQATVIFYQSHWVVQKLITDVRHTCAP